MNPVPGWFPHHWHYLSHWQWFRLPPPSKSSLKEETLQPRVWWLSSYILSFTSTPHLSCSVLSPPTVPVPGLSHNFSTHWSPSIPILPAVLLFLSFPLISLLSIRKSEFFLKLATKADFSDYWNLREGVKTHAGHGINLCQASPPHSKAVTLPSLVQRQTNNLETWLFQEWFDGKSFLHLCSIS